MPLYIQIAILCCVNFMTAWFASSPVIAQSINLFVFFLMIMGNRARIIRAWNNAAKTAADRMANALAEDALAYQCLTTSMLALSVAMFQMIGLPHRLEMSVASILHMIAIGFFPTLSIIHLMGYAYSVGHLDGWIDGLKGVPEEAPHVSLTRIFTLPNPGGVN